MAGSVSPRGIEQKPPQDLPMVGPPEARFDKLLALLKDLTRQAFYGKLTVNYEAGKITYCRKEETIRL